MYWLHMENIASQVTHYQQQEMQNQRLCVRKHDRYVPTNRYQHSEALWCRLESRAASTVLDDIMYNNYVSETLAKKTSHIAPAVFIQRRACH